jgi:hypothetical protein
MLSHPTMIRVTTVHGTSEIRWAVFRNGAEYVFNTYHAALIYMRSHNYNLLTPEKG